MAIIVQSLKPEHLKGLVSPDLPYMPVTPENTNDIAFTAFINDEVAACAGITRFWDGVDEAWFIRKSEIDQIHRKSLFRAVCVILRKIVKEYRLRRVQATVLEDFELGHRFIKALCFQEEGLMGKYGPRGENFIRSALIAEEI